MSRNDYRQFLASKQKKVPPAGLPSSFVDDAIQRMPTQLFDWQLAAIRWSLLKGRAALFEECGLGKTLQQLCWAAAVASYTGKPVMVHCPIGVRQQTIAEAARFGIDQWVPVVSVEDQSDIVHGEPAIVIANYEKLHKFESSSFAGVVLDESSILKSFNGKTRQQLTDAYCGTPYRLACTATPSPNDHTELATHAEFLGHATRGDMLSRWFVHDSGDTSKYRLKGHSRNDFWQWVSGWAICLSKPSDLGPQYSDEGYDLPELITQDHVIAEDVSPCAKTGTLFGTQTLNATTINAVKRESIDARSDLAASIVCYYSDEPILIWCDTNYEADALIRSIAKCEDLAIEVRGSDTGQRKERSLASFSTGGTRILITKPSIAGFGMNWQHCSRMVFVGLSYSFEAYYQAVRRCYRFGQNKPVTAHRIMSEIEAQITDVVEAKQGRFTEMQSSMAGAMRDFQAEEVCGISASVARPAMRPISIPEFISGSETKCNSK
jgi:hypothetical protein